MVEEKSYIQVKNVSRSFTESEHELKVLKNINFSIEKGEFICIVGGSGCGKSTLLRIMSGLDNGKEGEVIIDSEIVTKPKKTRGFVFQENRLFPWLNVEDNIKFALDEGTNEEKQKKAQDSIELVRLHGFEKTYPKALSGGMAQRANIARALVNNPNVLFLDEPFGALDAFTKMQLQNELIQIKQEEGSTMIMVTHDIDEAIYLSDRIIVMDKAPGRIRDIVSVDLPRPRDRNDYHFTEIRRKIYGYFFEKSEIQEDYNI
jgi:sulfonate transport system ATP-binding protein